jgi:hypothetical protein
MESGIRMHRREFEQELERVVADIKATAQHDQLGERAAVLQVQLDKLAARYEKDNELGDLRYKLYEAQALLYYHQQMDSEALAFIEEAVRVRGQDYDLASQMRKKLGQSTQQITQEKFSAPKHVGIGGWLAVLMGGLILSILVNAFFISDSLNLYDDVAILFDRFMGLRVLVVGMMVEAGVLVALALTAVVFIFQRRQAGRGMVISVLITAVIFAIINAGAANWIFREHPNLRQLVSDPTQLFGSVVLAGVWIPYLWTSQRVRRTLTEI